MCCAIAALLIAAIAAWRRGFEAALAWRPWARSAAASVAAAIGIIAGLGVATQHFGHYSARAQANGRTVLAEILAEPIYSGGSQPVRVIAGLVPAIPARKAPASPTEMAATRAAMTGLGRP
jgi:hypothetical protein